MGIEHRVVDGTIFGDGLENELLDAPTAVRLGRRSIAWASVLSSDPLTPRGECSVIRRMLASTATEEEDRSVQHRLVGLCITALALMAFGRLAAASGAAVRSHVELKVTVAGSGTVRVSGTQSLSCIDARCTRTFHIRRGQRVRATALPRRGWTTLWGGQCWGTSRTCFLGRQKRWKSVWVTFVPPGGRLNPYPIGTAATLVGDWSLRVNSALINADAEVAAVTDQNGNPVNRPYGGTQFTLVNVSMTYLGVGTGDLSQYVVHWLHAEGRGTPNTSDYDVQSCWGPPPDLFRSGLDSVLPGQTETGNLCFRIGSVDAGTLLLKGVTITGDVQRSHWFALS